MTEFFCGTRIIAGSGALMALKDLKAQRLLVVTDPFFAKNGTAQRIARQSGAERWEIFDRVEPDPTAELAAMGTAKVREFQPDVIVALGGGSAMDCAKAMLYFAESVAKLVAVPTTSGSGSEVTDFAILTHGGTKHPLVDPKLRPFAAILDDELLSSLPKSLIADAGFDIISHALEALAAKNAGAITDALARDAFCTAVSLLPGSFRGYQQGRLQIHQAATMAGMAFTQAGLGLCHALAHSLGGLYHIPHGRLNAILLPEVVEFNAPAVGEKYAELARMAGIGSSADSIALRNLKNGLVRLRRQLELPENLAQAGLSPRQVRQDAPKIVEAALADPCCLTNPRPVTAGAVHQILDEVTGRG